MTPMTPPPAGPICASRFRAADMPMTSSFGPSGSAVEVRSWSVDVDLRPLQGQVAPGRFDRDAPGRFDHDLLCLDLDPPLPQYDTAVADFQLDRLRRRGSARAEFDFDRLIAFGDGDGLVAEDRDLLFAIDVHRLVLSDK